MSHLFGVPVGTLAVALTGAVGVVIAVVVALATRNRVLVRLATRQVARGRARTALIVVGLMLGTAIIASALGTGDTIGRSLRASVIESLGETDELVAVPGADTDALLLGQPATVEYFDEQVAEVVVKSVPDDAPIAGIRPAIIEPVAVQDRTSRQNEPRVSLNGFDPAAGFDEITAAGEPVSVDDLGPGEVYVDADAAEDLGAAPSDRLRILAGSRVTDVTVAAVVDARGTGSDGASILMPLAAAQDVLARPGQVKFVLVSNDGGPVRGATHTDAVIEALEPVLGDHGLEALPIKQDGLDLADEQGATFMSVFTTFGMFSIAAGILLIFLIFVMLAAERRSEMSVARAIGTQRGQLVQTFLFEGFVYDVAAAAVGAAAGLGIAYLMVQVISTDAVVGTRGLRIDFDLQPRSLVIAYTMGVLLTLVVVGVSAWRVSRLNIVAGVRNLPDPPSPRAGRSRWAGIGLLLASGLLMTAVGVTSALGTPFLLGVSLVVVGVVLLARALGAPERVVYTAGGVVLVVWWLLPFSVYQMLVADLEMNFSVFVVSGLAVVLGATWTLMYNSDALIGGATRVASRMRSLAPVLKTAMAYPLRNRFRTGMTLAMFTLVVFTLVVGTTISTAFIKNFDDEEAFGGGFDIRAETAPFAPVDDLREELDSAAGIDPDDLEVVASQSFLPVDARQVGKEGSRATDPYVVRGLDRAFLDHTKYGFSAVADGYGSDEAVWQALENETGLAVVDGFVVPRRQNWSFGTPPDFRLRGFFVEDETFAPVPVEITDPQTGTTIRLTVIGVLSDTVPLEMTGILTAQRTLAPLGDRAAPLVHYFATAPGVDATAIAHDLESAFLANGMEAEAMSDILADAVGVSWMFNRLVLGFLGLGLIVGVAALAVVSARSVVERRQQIGVLRAIGFQRGMVRSTFVLEASLVSIASIVAGTALGLVLSFNIIRDTASRPGYNNLAFSVPWVSLGVVFAAVFLAALLASSLPARKAARVQPADALRYQ